MPVAAREFSRTEHLLIRFAAYGASDAPPALSAKLLGRGGAAIRTLAVSTEAAGDNAIDLPLANLAAGEYIIELTATTGGTEVKDRLGFRVTS